MGRRDSGACHISIAPTGEQRIKLQRILLLMGGFIIVQTMTLKLEYTNRVLLHSAISYMVMGIGTLLLLEGLARVAGHRWARTIMTGIYSAFVLILMWVLAALSRAAQTWAGVSGHHAHGAAAVSDSADRSRRSFSILLLPFVQGRAQVAATHLWRRGFLAILIAVEWPFATFLMSSLARNRFFSTTDFPYFALPTSPTVNHVFVPWERSSARVLAQHGAGISVLRGQHVGRHLLGQLAEKGETVGFLKSRTRVSCG